MTQFGLLLGALVVVSASSLYFAVRYYREARRGDPGRVYELETELAELKSAYAEVKSQALAANESAAASPKEAPTTPQSVVVPAAPAAPAAPVAQTAPAAPVGPVAPVGVAAPAELDWFSKLVPNVMPSPESLAIRLQNMKAWVSNGQIRVRGSFQYTRNDNGAQTGRFLVVAKGHGDALWVHPKAAWNPPTETTIGIARGESFSVGRFREIRVDFGSVTNRKEVEEIRILVFDREGRQLISNTIPVTNPPPKPVTIIHEPPAGEPTSATP